MAVSSDAAAAPQQIRLPVRLTFAALVAGLALGWSLSEHSVSGQLRAVAGPVGTLWLRGLQMTIVPLVAALLVMGVNRIVATARAGPVARRSLGWMIGLLSAGAVMAGLVAPALLAAFPIPGGAATALAVDGVEVPPLPELGAFVESLVAPNVIAAAASTAMVPLLVFFVALAVAISKLPESERDLLLRLFEALGHAMLTVISWVLWLAPIGVFALAMTVALESGGHAFVVLGHYIAIVATLGLLLLLAAYVVAAAAGQRPDRFARAVLPAQVIALTTQSSLASLPAMLGSCRALAIRESTADFVLPLAVAIFRVTGPAMNLGVAIYVAHLTGVELTAPVIGVGAAVAVLTSMGSISLPGAITFVSNIGPVALVMGVPIEPLALLVAVEMLPDIARTLSNVTMDVAVAATVDRTTSDSA